MPWSRCCLPTPVIVGDGHQLPFRDATASAVLAMHMLYQLEDIDCGISELHRILRPGGIALVSTNSATDKAELDDLWSTATGDLLGRPRGPRRISLSARFPLEDAPAVLSRHFHEVRVITYPVSSP